MLKEALGSTADLRYAIQLGGGLQFEGTLLVLSSLTAFRVAFLSFMILTRFVAASGSGFTGCLQLHIHVTAALLRGTVGSAAPWFEFGVLNDFMYHLFYFLAFI